MAAVGGGADRGWSDARGDSTWQVVGPIKAFDLPSTLVACRSTNPAKGALLLRETGPALPGCRAGQDGGREPKLEGRTQGHCASRSIKGRWGRVFLHRQRPLAGNTARCPFAASRARSWQAAPFWPPWAHCYYTWGSPPAMGSTPGTRRPGLPAGPPAPPGSCRSCPPSRYRLGSSWGSPVLSLARRRLCF